MCLTHVSQSLWASYPQCISYHIASCLNAGCDRPKNLWRSTFLAITRRCCCWTVAGHSKSSIDQMKTCKYLCRTSYLQNREPWEWDLESVFLQTLLVSLMLKVWEHLERSLRLVYRSYSPTSPWTASQIGTLTWCNPGWILTGHMSRR